MRYIASTRLSSAAPDDEFPPEVVRCIASFLLGVEVIQYAHASPALHTALNVPEVWIGRVEPLEGEAALLQGQLQTPAWCCPAKAVYLQQRSVLLRGMSEADWSTKWPRCGDFVALPYKLFAHRAQFSIELTFSIFPPSARASTCDGGVLVGFQDVNCLDVRSPLHQAKSMALSVDADRALHLTADHVSVSTTPTTATLAFKQWYHLRMVFHEAYGGTGHLDAYLDGDLCFSVRTPRGFRWGAHIHGQIGTGIMRLPLSKSCHDEDPRAWRPLHGLVAAARVFGPVQSGDECVSDLVHGEPDPHEQRVVASRPCERYAHMLLRQLSRPQTN